MNVKMWLKAIQIIPHVSKEEWDQLDVISRWLIATRAAVLVMTLTSAVIGGLLAAIDGKLIGWRFALVIIGLVFAHATNNMVNDFTDYRHGVDKDNYFRTQYGPQPLESGLMTEKQILRCIAATGGIAAAAGLALILTQATSTPGSPWVTLALTAAGAFFVLFYTWPLKYITLGEITVLMVWGPLMIGGGYYAITGTWSWGAVLASLPYALATVAVIFGKHIDKRKEDREKHIYTLPVLIGETAGRYSVLGMFALQYILPVAFIFILPQYFSWIILLVFATPFLLKKQEREMIWKIYTHPRPSEPPEEAKSFWPMWYVAAAMLHTRLYGGIFALAMILQTILWKVMH